MSTSDTLETTGGVQRAGGEAPHVRITPPQALVDETVAVRVEGCVPDQLATLRAHTTDDEGLAWESWATFRADSAGRVDVGATAPVASSYAGTDPTGLFWSMRPVAPQAVPFPYTRRGSWAEPVVFTLEIAGQPAATAILERRFVAPDVVEERPDTPDVRGVLFRPADPGPHPGMVVFGGSGGGLGWADEVASLLASRGFAALALAYFRYEGLPDRLREVPLEYFAGAIEWLRAHPTVQGGRVGVTGISRGGELALLLGAMLPDQVDAVVAYAPSHVTFPTYWTFGGAALPGLPPLSPERLAQFPPDEPLPLTPRFLARLEDHEAARTCAIPVERSRCPIMLISGQDDAMWPAALMSDRALERLRSHGYAYPAHHLSYPDAGHYLRFPYLPTTVHALLHPVSGWVYAIGGTDQGDAAAQADLWPRVLSFLAESLGTPAR